MPDRRVPWDLDAYERRVRSACFVCETVAGNPDFEAERSGASCRVRWAAVR